MPHTLLLHYTERDYSITIKYLILFSPPAKQKSNAFIISFFQASRLIFQLDGTPFVMLVVVIIDF